jgi:hypothetical protein
VYAQSDEELLVAVYANAVVPIGECAAETVTIVNGTYSDRVVIDLAVAGTYRLTATTCTGRTLEAVDLELRAGIHALPIPGSGYATLEQLAG